MHVLIVEDNKKMARLLKKGLEERNHSVTLAFDGCTGFEAAIFSDFAALILDLMLPRMDGFEFLRRLRQDDNKIPILVLSARDATTDIVRALDLGADDYLTKPFSFVELLARLRHVSFRHDSLEHARHSTARKTRIHFQRQTLSRVGVHHAQHANPASAFHRVLHEVQRPLLVRCCAGHSCRARCTGADCYFRYH
jgi:DNA-binding response OmpR family regulator